jgi:predicted flap endonuclease-1-like 5' DNA nuclease
MFKKLIFIALGVTIIAAKKSAALLSSDRWRSRQAVSDAEVEQIEMRTEAAGATVEAIVEVSETVTPGPKVSRTKVDAKTGDDLTSITGIGPTYAARLQVAGITTFQELANRTPDELREIVRARGESADTASWISQARELL